MTALSGFSSVAEALGQSKQSIDLELEYFQINEERYILLTLADEISKVSLGGAVVDLFLNNISETGKLGSITTDETGKGRLTLNEKFMAAADTITEYIFIAILKDDRRYEDSEAELIIRAVDLNMEAYTEDDIKYVRATLLEKMDSGETIPVEWEELLFEVERLFGLLPVEEFAFTDDYGEVIIEYPDDLPGDEEGNLVIVVRLSEHPDYGNVEVRETIPWGIPLTATSGLYERRTWMSKDPPLFFVFIFWGGVMAAWGTIGYVIFNVLKINQSKFEN